MKHYKIFISTLLWISLVIIPIIGVVPFILYSFVADTPHLNSGIARWIGLWFIVNGVLLSSWCIYLFVLFGEGTPFGSDGPKQFVGLGPYRLVRNPMSIGAFLVLLGECVLYSNVLVWLYCAVLISIGIVMVYRVEEPMLKRKFSSAYCAYTDEVPRWIPKSHKGA